MLACQGTCTSLPLTLLPIVLSLYGFHRLVALDERLRCLGERHGESCCSCCGAQSSSETEQLKSDVTDITCMSR